MAESCDNLRNEKDVSGIKSMGKFMLRQLKMEFGIDEEDLAKKQEKNFCEDYGKVSVRFGERLYTTDELLDPNLKLDLIARLIQFFLRGGSNLTLRFSENFPGLQRTKVVLDKNHPLTKLFVKSGIGVSTESFDLIEVDESDIPHFVMTRNGDRYGGDDEFLIVMQKYGSEPDVFQKTGYRTNAKMDWEASKVHELMHATLFRHFGEIFSKNILEQQLVEPIKSFNCEIDGLNFRTMMQASEFLGEVAEWAAGGTIESFFSNFFFDGGIDHPYWYNFQVLKYAMKNVLKSKGVQKSEQVVENLLVKARTTDVNEVFAVIRGYFKEDDIRKVGIVFQKIGVQLLKQMGPYFEK